MRLFKRRRPRRYDELINHQLAIFAEEHSELAEELSAALAVYRAANKASAEESFGDVQDVAEEGRDALERLREGFATTLEEELADAYRVEFDQRAAQRYPEFALELDVWARDDD